MRTLNPYVAIQPDSFRFAEYLDAVKVCWIDDGVRPQRINAAVALLRELERLRLCYSKNVEAAYRSKKISNAELAEKLGYRTVRQVQKIRQWLEEQGILSVRRQKSDKFYNRYNSYDFTGFREWFIRCFQQDNCKTGHPKEENDQRSLFKAKPKSLVSFPKENLTTWNTQGNFWRVLALEVSAKPPCLSALSAKFRIHLRRKKIPNDHPSIIGHWKGYVKRAVEFQIRPWRET